MDADTDLSIRPARLDTGATWRACPARGTSIRGLVPPVEEYVAREAGRADDRAFNGGDSRRFPEATMSSGALMFSLSSWYGWEWESRVCLERDEVTVTSVFSGVWSRVTLRGTVRDFEVDDAVGAECDGAVDNRGPEATRLKERAGRSSFSDVALDVVSRTGYALSERDNDERTSGEFREIGDGGFLSSFGSIASSGGVGGVYACGEAFEDPFDILCIFPCSSKT